MATRPIYVCHNPRATAVDAANEFVASLCPGTKIRWQSGFSFRLADGQKTYTIDCTPDGWAICDPPVRP